MNPKTIGAAPGAPLRTAVAFLAAVAVLLFLPVVAVAQATGVVTGVVRAAGEGTPLAGVRISIEGTRLVTATDAAGAFRIAAVPAGRPRIVATQVGRASSTRVAELAAGAVVAVDFALAEEATVLPSVVVSATREVRRLGETAASVGVVPAEALREAKPTHPSEVMGRIPGVWVNVTGGEGHATAIRQPKTTNPVYLFLEDGVPTRPTGFFNHNALYEINLPGAERIEVLKGPATALYGSDAIGGVINVETRRPSLAAQADGYVEAGAFGYRRALLSASDTWGRNGLRADLNLTRTDGWRDGTGYDRQSATARWDHDFGGGAILRATVAGSRIDQQTAGSSSLLADDYRDRPTLNYTPISLRNVRTGRASAAFEKVSGATLVSVTPYARWNEMELLPNWSLTYDPTIYTSGHRSLGVLARVRHDLDALRTRVIAGVDVDHSPGDRVEHQVAASRDGRFFTGYTRGDLLYDYDVTFHSVSPYLQVESNPTERLHLTAGLRFDRMGYDYASALEPLQSGRWRRPADARVRYDHLSPKLGVTYDLHAALNVYGNYTHGFRAPSEGQLFRQGSARSTVDLAPVTANSVEAGVRGEVLGRVGYSLAVYRMSVENDVLAYVQPDGTRETQNAGATLHRGVEAGLGVELPAGLRADVGYSLVRHTYEEWSPRDGVSYAGNEMESAPRVLLNARLGWAPAFLPDARAAVEWSRVGGYWLDAENTHRYGGHDLFNLSLTAPVARRLSLVGRVMNVLDTRYAESASYTAARGREFAPGLPRSAYLGVQYRWER